MAESKTILANVLAATGATVQTRGGVQNQPTIFGACYKGDIERLEKYIKEGGCLDEGDKEKMTMLHHAVVGRQFKVMRMLIEGTTNSNINPIPMDAGDSSGWTALHYAADKGFVDCMEILVDEGGASVNSKDEMKRTPLHLAANSGHIEAVKFLLSKGAAKALKTVVGWTALKYAEENGFKEIAELLQ